MRRYRGAYGRYCIFSSRCARRCNFFLNSRNKGGLSPGRKSKEQGGYLRIVL